MSGALPALALSDGLRMVRHPVVGAGLAGSVAVGVGLRSSAPTYWYTVLTTLPSFLLAPAALFAANMVATRERRAGTAELVGAAPVTARLRTFATLLAALGPALLCAVLLAATSAAVPSGGGPRPRFAEIAVQPILVLCGGLLGVAVARLLPFPGTATAVLVLLLGWVVAASDPPRQVWLAPYGQLVRVSPQTMQVVAKYAGSPAWHDAYLLCLGLLAAVAALLTTSGRRRDLLTAGAFLAVIATLAGWAQLPSADVPP